MKKLRSTDLIRVALRIARVVVLVARKNFDILQTSQEQKNGTPLDRTRLMAGNPAHICYEPQLPAGWEQRKQQHNGRRYRIGGTSLISLSQAIDLKSAIDFSASIGTPLVEAHQR
jgi:hypothetical protein